MRERLDQRHGDPFAVRREHGGIDLTGREPLEHGGARDGTPEADTVIEPQAESELPRLVLERASPAC